MKIPAAGSGHPPKNQGRQKQVVVRVRVLRHGLEAMGQNLEPVLGFAGEPGEHRYVRLLA